MFDGLAIPVALETARRNAVRVPTFNAVLTTGDDTTFAVSVYEPDGTPTDISGCAVTLTVIAAHMDPGGSRKDWSGWGYGSDGYGYDYGLGWWTCRERIVTQVRGSLTDPCCGQASIVLPRETTSAWRDRYHLLISLDSEYGGNVQTCGVLDVRRGAQISRLGTAGYVNISDGVVGPVGGMGILDGVGIIDGTTLVFMPGRIGRIAPTPNTGPQQAVFTVSLESPAQQTVTVRWQTVDGSAMAPDDYTASEGTLMFLPGQVSQTIVVPVRPYSNAARATEFYVHLCAGNGAVIVTADGTAIIPGWVGILDDVFLVDGTTAAFVPGLVGVRD